MEEDMAVTIDPEKSPPRPNRTKASTDTYKDESDDEDSDDIDAELNKLEQSVQ